MRSPPNGCFRSLPPKANFQQLAAGAPVMVYLGDCLGEEVMVCLGDCLVGGEKGLRHQFVKLEGFDAEP
jgi:hypothetical protein